MSEFQWCLMCQRASKKRRPEQAIGIDSECPHEDCEGYLGNLWDWDSFRQGRPDLPKVPEEGKAYPLSQKD